MPDKKRGCVSILLAVLLTLALTVGAYPAFAAVGEQLELISLPTAPVRVYDKENGTIGSFPLSGGRVRVVSDSREVPGEFQWTGDTGQIVPVGTTRYPVRFVPASDTFDNEITGLVAITVTPSTPPLMTADEINSLAHTATIENIDTFAQAMRSCTNKQRLTRSTIETLSRVFYRAHPSYTETASVNTSNATTNRMPDDAVSYGGAIAVDGPATIKIYQDKPSGSAYLQFDIALNGNEGTAQSPLALRIGLPSGWNNAYDYDLRGSRNSPAASISRSGDRYYLSFVTDSLGTFKLYRESRNDGDDEEDSVSSFWENVMDEIADAKRGEQVRVNVGNRGNMPAEVLRELKGRSVYLILRRNGKSNIVIYGKDVGSVPSNREYYTMSALASLYGSASSSTPPVSSCPPVIIPAPVQPIPPPRPPVPPTPPAQPVPPPTPPPQPVPPPTPPTPPPLAPVSSAPPPPENVVSQPEESELEIVAEEDPPAESEMESSKTQESTGGAPGDPMLFGMVVVLSLSLAAVISGVITFAVANHRRKRWQR